MPSLAADEAQITLAAEDLIQASRACYMIIFLLAAVRLGATLIDDNIWSKLFDPNRPDLGWEPLPYIVLSVFTLCHILYRLVDVPYY
eukprot:scaffold2832_cov132-Skeletonema_dohrnii-CCMP3373.AAC.2